MTCHIRVLFVCFILFGLSTSYVVQDTKKCSIKDFDCQTALYQQTMLSSTRENGIPEVGIPQTDPFVLKNVTISLLDLINFTVTDGVAEGVKSCIFHKVMSDFDTKNFTMDFTCDMVIKGKYKLTSSPILQAVVGFDFTGEGNIEAIIEKLNVKAGFTFFVKKTDGEIYFDYSYEGMTFSYNIENLKMSFDKLFIDNRDVSKSLEEMVNSNPQFFLTSYGRPFMQKSMDIFFNYTHKFFDNTPAKDFITDDLSQYL